ncbi:MAG: VPLPA-CTERM sorting domain-containing protein [Bdellovibrionales bacterium]
MQFRFLYLAVAALLGAVAAPQQASAAYTMTNTNGGNGYVVDANTTDGNYTIYGSDDCGYHDGNYTTYTNIATYTGSMSFAWSYTTYDENTAWWDPAGYVINGAYTQLTPDDSQIDYYWEDSPYHDPNYPSGSRTYSGVATLQVIAGQTYGFYVNTYDDQGGFAKMEISAVPLPAALPLFAASLFGFGAVSRKKRA